MITYRMPRRLGTSFTNAGKWMSVVLGTVCATGCPATQEINPDDLSISIDGYQDWHKIEPLLGPLPAHGDTYRILYVNDIARDYSGAGFYPVGSAMVKEIYDLVGADARGDLSYTAVMRRYDADAEPDLPLMGDWLFTFLSTSGAETQMDSCWDSCHRQSPFSGAWFNHGR